MILRAQEHPTSSGSKQPHYTGARCERGACREERLVPAERGEEGAPGSSGCHSSKRSHSPAGTAASPSVTCRPRGIITQGQRPDRLPQGSSDHRGSHRPTEQSRGRDFHLHRPVIVPLRKPRPGTGSRLRHAGGGGRVEPRPQHLLRGRVLLRTRLPLRPPAPAGHALLREPRSVATPGFQRGLYGRVTLRG